MLAPPVFEEVLQAQGHTAECQIVPGDFRLADKGDVEAFLPGAILRRAQVATVKEMDLVNVGHVDHGERGADNHARAGLLQSFAGRGFSGSLAVFHEPGGQRPETVARLDGPATKKYPVFPLGDAADDKAGVLVVDVPATLAYMPGKVVSGRNADFDGGGTLGAELDHGAGQRAEKAQCSIASVRRTGP